MWVNRRQEHHFGGVSGVGGLACWVLGAGSGEGRR